MPAPREQDQRQQDRTPCRIKATIRYMGSDARSAVLDLSEDGVRIYLGEITAEVGHTIAIQTDELGYLTGTVTWVKKPYAGLRLAPSSNTSAKVFSYFRR